MSVRARASSAARVRGGPGFHAGQAAQGHGCEVSAGCRSLCLVRGLPPWLRTPESAATARDDVLASQEQNRWAVRSHWCFGTRTRIRRYERFTAVAYEHYAFYAERDAALVEIRIQKLRRVTVGRVGH